MNGRPTGPEGDPEGQRVFPEPILHMTVPAPVGGLERVVQGLATGQHARGCSVHVTAVVSSHDHPFLEPLREAGVPTHVMIADSGGFLRERRFVRRILHEVRPRVVHTHGYRPDLLDAPVARSRGIATVTTEHGNSKRGGKTAIYEWAQARKRRDFDAVIAVSGAIASRLETEERVPANRIHLIPNSWSGAVDFLDPDEARVRLKLPEGEPVVGWVGRMIQAKGPDVMAEAVREMGLRGSVVFIGDGPMMPSVRSILERDGTLDRARFVGHLDNAAPLFPAFDVFALSSRTEGAPIVLLEAMAAGVPIVATEVGGVPDMLSRDEAVLVPPEDPGALGRALQRALEDPESMRARAARATARLQRDFSADAWLDRHEMAYRSALRVASGTDGRI